MPSYKTPRAFFAVVAVLLLVPILAVLADVESYRELRSTPAEVLTGATSADSTTATTVIASRMKASNSNPTVAVSVDFSGTVGDTVVVSCLLFKSGTFLGLSTATATAGAYVDAAGDNIAPLLMFDTAGADTYEIRHAAPSAGNVDVRWWSFGASSQQ